MDSSQDTLSEGLARLAAQVADEGAGKVSEQIRADFQARLGRLVQGAATVSKEIDQNQDEVLAAVLRSLNRKAGIDIVEIITASVDRWKALRSEFEALQAQLAQKDIAIGPLQKRIEQLENDLSQMKSALAEKDMLLRQAEERMNTAERASGDILMLRETILKEMDRMQEKILEATEKVRARAKEKGAILVAEICFEHIRETYERCFQAFDLLNPDLLGNIRSFSNVVGELTALGTSVESANSIPSIGLYERAVACLRTLQVLKEIQDQLLADQMAQPEVPNEWLNEETGQVYDFYMILGVERTADESTLKKAYRARSQELHPDRNHAPDAAKRFSEVKMAYDVLSDREKRAFYDQLLT